MENTKNYQITYHLDVRGYSCPYPATETFKALKTLKKGEILQVVSDCTQSLNNIPVDAKNYGYDVLDVLQEDGLYYFVIQRNF